MSELNSWVSVNFLSGYTAPGLTVPSGPASNGFFWGFAAQAYLPLRQRESLSQMGKCVKQRRGFQANTKVG